MIGAVPIHAIVTKNKKILGWCFRMLNKIDLIENSNNFLSEVERNLPKVLPILISSDVYTLNQKYTKVTYNKLVFHLLTKDSKQVNLHIIPVESKQGVLFNLVLDNNKSITFERFGFDLYAIKDIVLNYFESIGVSENDFVFENVIPFSNTDVHKLYNLARNKVFSYSTVKRIFEKSDPLDNIIKFNSKRSFDKYKEFEYSALAMNCY